MAPVQSPISLIRIGTVELYIIRRQGTFQHGDLKGVGIRPGLDDDRFRAGSGGVVIGVAIELENRQSIGADSLTRD